MGGGVGDVDEFAVEGGLAGGEIDGDGEGLQAGSAFPIDRVGGCNGIAVAPDGEAVEGVEFQGDGAGLSLFELEADDGDARGGGIHAEDRKIFEGEFAIHLGVDGEPGEFRMVARDGAEAGAMEEVNGGIARFK